MKHYTSRTETNLSMATWFDLPAEIKAIIYQLIFNVQQVSLRQGCLITAPAPEHNAKNLFSVLMVSRDFANKQEVVSAILASAVIVLRRPWDFVKMKALYPVEQTAMIRQLYLKTSKTIHGWEVRDRFDSFLSGKHNLSTQMPNLRTIWIWWDAKEANNRVIIQDVRLTLTHETFRKLSQPSETLSAPYLGDHRDFKQQLQEATCGLLEVGTGRRYVRPWLGRVISYALSHSIHLELKFVLNLQHGRRCMAEALDVLRIATFDVPDWQLRFQLENGGEEFSFSQDATRRLFEMNEVRFQKASR